MTHRRAAIKSKTHGRRRWPYCPRCKIWSRSATPTTPPMPKTSSLLLSMVCVRLRVRVRVRVRVRACACACPRCRICGASRRAHPLPRWYVCAWILDRSKTITYFWYVCVFLRVYFLLCFVLLLVVVFFCLVFLFFSLLYLTCPVNSGGQGAEGFDRLLAAAAAAARQGHRPARGRRQHELVRQPAAGDTRADQGHRRRMCHCAFSTHLFTNNRVGANRVADLRVRTRCKCGYSRRVLHQP